LTDRDSFEIPESEHRINNLSDAAIIIRASGGDRSAFEVLVNRYQQRVLSVAYRIVGNPEDARDVAQDVFIRLYRFLNTYQGKKRFFTWLYRIIVNTSFDFLRKKNRFRIISLDDLPEKDKMLVGSQTDHDDEFTNTVNELTMLLSTEQRTAFILCEVEGFSCREISKIMECNGNTARSYLYHARKKLQVLMKKHYPEFLEGSIGEL